MKVAQRITALLVAVVLSASAFAGSFSDTTENNIITHMFRTGSWTKPTVLAAALGTACSDSSFTEIANSGSYARVNANPLDATWSAATAGNGTTSNVGAITFPTPTANWNSGSAITHWALYDSATYGAGNMLVCAALTASKTVNNGADAPYFPAAAATVQVDN
jgi:hypothetical protein